MTEHGPGSGWASLWVLLLDLGVVLLLSALVVDRYAPPQHLPWKPLSLDHPIGAATALKVQRAGADPVLCRRILREGGVRLTDVPERREGVFCAVSDAVRLQGGVTPLAPAAPVMTCRVALAYAVWDRQALQPAARQRLGSAPAEVRHFGTYACRRQYGAAEGRVSEHATANALDVAGVVLADGRRVSVVADFADDGAAGLFWREVRRSACEVWRVVLSPDYNAAHADHLHLDQGPFRACR